MSAVKQVPVILAVGFVIVASIGLSAQFTRAGLELADISVVQATRVPIVIKNNTQLDLFCAGNGTDGLTPATAHVINNVVIDGAWNGTCIKISNVDRHLVLWNVTVTRAGYSEYSPADAGIMLSNCSNILINASAAIRNEVGIWLKDCHDCVIANSTADLNLYSGLILQDSGGVNVTGNVLRNNHCYGMKLESGSIGTNIINNTIADTFFNIRVQPTAAGTGIYAWGATNATIGGNYITGCGTYGILLDESDNFVICANILINCYQDCVGEWSGTGNGISFNLCFLPFPSVAVALLISVALALVLVIASIALIRVGQSRRASQGASWKPVPAGKVIFGAVAILAGLSAFALFIPLSMKSYIVRDTTHHEIIMIWGVLSDFNPQHELVLQDSPALFSCVAGVVLLVGCIIYLLVKRSNQVQDKTAIAKAFTVPIWCFTSLAAAFTALSIFPRVLTLNPTIVPIDLFLLNVTWLLCCIAGLVFSWRVRVGPWLVPPNSWDALGKRNPVFRDYAYKVKNLLDIGKEGVISIDAVAVTWNCTTTEANRQIRDLLLHRYIDGKFVERGTAFSMLGVNLSFINKGLE